MKEHVAAPVDDNWPDTVIIAGGASAPCSWRDSSHMSYARNVLDSLGHGGLHAYLFMSD